MWLICVVIFDFGIFSKIDEDIFYVDIIFSLFFVDIEFIFLLVDLRLSVFGGVKFLLFFFYIF